MCSLPDSTIVIVCILCRLGKITVWVYVACQVSVAIGEIRVRTIVHNSCQRWSECECKKTEATVLLMYY